MSFPIRVRRQDSELRPLIDLDDCEQLPIVDPDGEPDGWQWADHLVYYRSPAGEWIKETINQRHDGTEHDWVIVKSAEVASDRRKYGKVVPSQIHEDSSSTYERDQYILDEYNKGTQLNTIMTRVNSNKKWEELNSETAVKKRVNIHAVKYNIKVIPRYKKRTGEAN